MTETIHVGTLLLADGTALPEAALIGTQKYAKGWSSITSTTRFQLAKEIEKGGWTFFYMAGQIHARGFGFDDRSRTDRAIVNLIEAVKREKCNCLEITQIERRSFLGMRYTNLIARARHIQEGRTFHDASKKPDSTRSRPSEWLNDHTPPQSLALIPGAAVGGQ